MKLMIDIPEEEYELVRHENKSFRTELELMNAVANGTPLPKGHGRLIDADELIKNWYDEYIKFMTREEIESMDGVIENAPTIIEADNGGGTE